MILKNKIKLFAPVFLIGFFMVAQSALALGITNKVYLEGSVSPIAPGSKFIVNVYLDAKDPINAFDLEVNYPPGSLKFIDFDNSDSIVDIWQPKPALSSDGNIKLSGAIIKAFSGSRGLLIKLAFEALNANKSEISFIKSSLYIADGKGTEVKPEIQNFSVSVKEGGAVVPSSFVPFKETPSNITINKGLETYKLEADKKGMLEKSKFTPNFIFLVIFIIFIFVICVIVVYNKIKRKI